MVHTNGAKPGATRGRGAISNRTGRFERLATEAVDDGWERLGPPDPEDEPPPLRTTVEKDTSRRVIARNQSPDIPFDRSINPYRGCEHGCVYCFARPTHAYLGLSPGLDFETRLFAKPDAAAILRQELSAPGYAPAVIAMGANTDPYQPIEGRLRITRSILEVLAECGHPVSIVTKSDRVTRDIDILAPMAKAGLAQVAVSVTTLDPSLARAMEPRCPAPRRRLEAIGKLTAAGVPVAVMAAPMIPHLNDHELERILAAAAAHGAAYASYTSLRLPLEIAGLVEEWLRVRFPDRADRVLNGVRAMRGGELYDARFGARMVGRGVEAELLGRRFKLACAKHGLGRRPWTFDLTRFRKPSPAGQLSLL